ncbi:MAG: glycosyltransferase family 4 protein [Cyclobacteriaceae bacterium]
MKVGIFIGDISKEEGGGFTFQKSILNHLSLFSEVYRFYLFYYSKKNFLNAPSSDSVRHVKLEDLNLVQRVKRKIRNFGKSVKDTNGALHNTATQLDISIIWFPTYRFEKTDIPYIYTIWDLQHRLQPVFPELLDNSTWEKRELHYDHILKKAAYILTGTKAGKNEIINFYDVDSSRIKLLPHPIPQLNAVAKELSFEIIEKLGIESPYILYPSQFWPHKNHIRLLKALKILIHEKGLKMCLVLTGSNQGNQNFIEEKIREYGLDEYVHILGFIGSEELSALYQNALALTYVTLFGPENLPPLEAMSLGCPAIVSNVSGSMEQYGDNVLYFDKLDHVDLSRKIIELHQNQELRNQLIQKGHRRASSYTPREYVLDMEKIFEEFREFSICWS